MPSHQNSRTTRPPAPPAGRRGLPAGPGFVAEPGAHRDAVNRAVATMLAPSPGAAPATAAPAAEQSVRAKALSSPILQRFTFMDWESLFEEQTWKAEPVKGAKQAKGFKQDAKVSKGFTESKGFKESKSSKGFTEAKASKAFKGDSKSSKGFESKASKGFESKSSKGFTDAKASKGFESKSSKDFKESKAYEATSSKESKDSKYGGYW